MRVHIIHGHREYEELQRLIDTWLRDAQQAGKRVIDIKYGYAADGSWGWYSAMIIYE